MSACSTRHEHCFHRWHGELRCRIERIYSLPAYITFLRSKFTQGGSSAGCDLGTSVPPDNILFLSGLVTKLPPCAPGTRRCLRTASLPPAPRLLPQPPAGPAPSSNRPAPRARGERGPATRQPRSARPGGLLPCAPRLARSAAAPAPRPEPAGHPAPPPAAEAAAALTSSHPHGRARLTRPRAA